jgi:O-antigen/teichoic acid export membrane protein
MARDGYERRLAVGTVVNAAGALFSEALNLLAVGVAVERVGATAFGVFVLAQGIAQLPYVLESGVGQLVVRLVAAQKGDDESASLLRVATTLYALLGVGLLACGLIASRALLPLLLDVPDNLEHAATGAFAWVVVAYAVRLATGFVPRILVGAARLVALRVVGSLRSATVLVATLALVDRHQSDVTSVALAFLVGEVVAAVVGLLLVGMPGKGPWWSRDAVRHHVRASGPMVTANVLALASSRADPIIVAVGAGAAATGTYGVVFRIYEAARSAIELLSLFLMPGTARRLAAGDRPGVASLYGRAVRWIAVVVWPLAIAVAVLSPELLGAWVGRDLVDGPEALVAAMALVVVATPGVAAFYVITGADAVRRAVGVQAIGAAVSLALGVALVAPVGVAAVFIGSAAAAVFTGVRFVQLVGTLTGSRVRHLAAPMLRPALIVAGLGVVLAAVASVDASDVSTLARGGGVLVFYAAVAVTWAIPPVDRRALARSLSFKRGAVDRH